MRTLQVAIYGASTPLGSDTVSRLIQQGHVVGVVEEESVALQDALNDVLTHCTGKLLNINPEFSPTVAISFFMTPSSLEYLIDSNAGTKMLVSPAHAELYVQEIPEGISEIVVHDMIHQRIDANWSPAPFSAWMADEEEILDDRICYWVSWRDVVEALCILAGTRIELPRFIDICGRRSISLNASKKEFMRLLNRSKSALSSTLGVEHLTSETEDEQSNTGRKHRPDLKPLHDALSAAGKEGWQPLMGVEVSMLEWLAFNFQSE